MENITPAGDRERITTPPTFRYNHPKNYFGVPIAIAAPDDTGGLIQAHVVRGAGAARHGAEQLDLITSEGDLTMRGTRVTNHARDVYGDLVTALDRFADWRGTTTRFVELDDGVWEGIAAEVVAAHPVVTDVMRLLEMYENRLRLPELAHMYLQEWPETARTVWVRESVTVPDADTKMADLFFDSETYRSGVTCQLKTIMYHAGIVTETGADSNHLLPETDVWELEPTASDYVPTRDAELVVGNASDGGGQ